MKALFHFLEREDLIAINPFRKVEVRLKETRRLPRTISLADLERLSGTSTASSGSWSLQISLPDQSRVDSKLYAVEHSFEAPKGIGITAMAPVT